MQSRRELLKWLSLMGIGVLGVGATQCARNGTVSSDRNSRPDTLSEPTETQRFEVVTVNSRGEITNRREEQAEVLKEEVNGTILEMVAIPGGEFLMGSPQDEEGRDDDEDDGNGNQVRVTVSPFYMGKYPVTQEQYEAVMSENPASFQGAQRPVEEVSWEDAQAFCEKLSQLTGQTYRLPSEAEWEYACRAGTTTPFYFGETITPELVNYNGNFPYGNAPKGELGEFRGETTEVGIFPPNAFGLYDLHGNVREWCEDLYHDNYAGLPRDGRAWVDNDNPYYGRTLRGGSWSSYARGCRSAYRNTIDPDNRFNGLGFRVVRVLA